MKNVVEIHDELLQAVAAAHQKLDGQHLTTFFPMRGTASTGELMVIGRAVNGWTNGWFAAELLEPVKRAEVLSYAMSRSIRDDCCPMSWVLEAWGRTIKNTYNSKKSAFWRMVRRVSHEILGASEKWSSQLIWSNLYKVAPYEGWNPSDRLCNIQQLACERHLVAEVDLWQPKRILLITGWKWAKPFIEQLGNLTGKQNAGPVQWSGIIERPDNSQIRIAVTIRPELKREAPIVEQILRSLA